LSDSAGKGRRRAPGAPRKSRNRRYAGIELGVRMKMLRFTSAVMFLALVGSPAAQLIPPSPTATLVNFDNIPLGPGQQIPFPVVTTEYTDSAGVTFAGFGQNAAGLFNPSFTPSDV